MASQPPTKKEYTEALEERIVDLEELIGHKINEPYTTENIASQILKLKDIVTKALGSLSTVIRSSIDEGNLSQRLFSCHI